MTNAESQVAKFGALSADGAVAAPLGRVTGLPPSIKLALQWVVIAFLAVASYLLISHFVVQTVKVIGQSMSPTLADSQRYLLNRWVLHFRAPRPADIVVLRDPADGGFSVKRVVAIAGDSVVIRHGSVFVNGRELEERYLAPGTRTYPASASAAEQSILVHNNEVLVLGDNRNYSVDSRAYGPVRLDNLLGLVVR